MLHTFFRYSARAAPIVCAAAMLAACSMERPQGATCPAVTGAPPPSFDASLADAVAARWSATLDHPRQRAAILVLSGGGAWGAYGAGFLNGWSERPASLGRTRPAFDVVTGVSTGAIIAPYAFLGSDYDARLANGFRGANADTVFIPRSILGAPFSNSLNDTAPLESNLNAALTDDVIDGIKSATAQRRSVWVGAANFDSAAFTEFNLSAIARDMPPDQARAQMVDRIMAASAVPAFFPPRFINGCMYMDGDVRQTVFVSHLHGAVKAAAGSDAPQADLYVIVNGTVGDHRILTDNSLIGIAVRGFEIAEGEIQLNSLREVYDYAQEHGYGFYWTSADDVVADPKDVRRGVCAGPQSADEQFKTAFTTCLFDAALVKARDRPMPWRTDRP